MGKPDKERMGQDMKYVIDSKVYENHINDEVHLYGLLHQLAFLAEKAKDEKDLENLVDTAKRYGEIAEEKFSAWRIPGRRAESGGAHALDRRAERARRKNQGKAARRCHQRSRLHHFRQRLPYAGGRSL